MTSPATLTRVMKKLKAAGTAQNVKVYRRHGVEGPTFGVSFAVLNSFRKAIGQNHPLARELWKSGNHDAMVLATMIADPGAMTSTELDQWAHGLRNYIVADAFSRMAKQSRHVGTKARRWTKSPIDWIGQVGWTLVAYLAMSDEALPESVFSEFVEIIQSRIHRSKNRTRYAMNSALIAIGTRSARLKQKALRAAEIIGTVTVDHGPTGCRTPDARQYILKSWDRKMS